MTEAGNVLVEVTPVEFRCALSMSCPAIFEAGGKSVIIGRTVTAADYHELTGRIGQNEAAVEVESGLLVKTETAWVVEDGTSPVYAPFYLSGITITPTGRMWARDILLAVRFARKVDAEKITIGWPAVEVRITEHSGV